jgi:hypothetical protein
MATTGAASDISVGLPKNRAAPCVITPPSLKLPLCSSAANRAAAVMAGCCTAWTGEEDAAADVRLDNDPNVNRAADETAPAALSHRRPAKRPAALVRIAPV